MSHFKPLEQSGNRSFIESGEHSHAQHSWFQAYVHYRTITKKAPRQIQHLYYFSIIQVRFGEKYPKTHPPKKYIYSLHRKIKTTQTRIKRENLSKIVLFFYLSKKTGDINAFILQFKCCTNFQRNTHLHSLLHLQNLTPGVHHWGQGLHTGSLMCAEAAVEESSFLVSWRSACRVSSCWGSTAAEWPAVEEEAGSVRGLESEKEEGFVPPPVSSSSWLLLAMKRLTLSRQDLIPSW